MKLYIIVTTDLHPIGGMQLYTSGKAQFLEKNGWTVSIISYGESIGRCAIRYLERFLKGSFPYIINSPAELTPFQLNCAKSKILAAIPDRELFSTIYVESQSDNTALWGELIAKELCAKHINFNCNEQFRGEYKQYEKNIDFFYFKYRRKELFGITSESLKKLFDGYYDVSISNEFVFKAIEPGPIQPVNNEKVNKIKKYEINIMYIGRLEKGYVPAIFDGVSKFAQNHSDKQIQLIVVGDATIRMHMIHDTFKKIKNVKITLMGDLVPIPASIYSKVDAVIAGAACAEISARMHVPTIVADCGNYKSNGVLGYTTNSSLYFDEKIGQTSFDESLEDVIFEKKYLKYTYDFPNDENSDEIYKTQLLHFSNLSNSLEFYDVTDNINYKKKYNVKLLIKILMPKLFCVANTVRTFIKTKYK